MIINWTDKKEKSTEDWNGTINKWGQAELRMSFETSPNYAQVLIVVDKDESAIFSMNGKASMTANEISRMASAVAEAARELRNA